MCSGFNGLAQQVQYVLGHDPFSDYLLVFEGRRDAMPAANSASR